MLVGLDSVRWMFPAFFRVYVSSREVAWPRGASAQHTCFAYGALGFVLKTKHKYWNTYLPRYHCFLAICFLPNWNHHSVQFSIEPLFSMNYMHAWLYIAKQCSTLFDVYILKLSKNYFLFFCRQRSEMIKVP